MHTLAIPAARLIAVASMSAMLISPQSILAGQLSPGAADTGLPRSLQGAVPEQGIVNAPAMIRIEGMDLLAAPGALTPSAARASGTQADRGSGSATIRKPAATVSAPGLSESRCPTLAALGGTSRISPMSGTAKASC